MQHGDYQLSVQSNDLILCSDDGGSFGDPFEGISIDRGCLLVHFFGGSAWRWDIQQRFRFQNHGFYLIGITELGYHDAWGHMLADDYNLLTGKLKVTTGDYFDKKKQQTHSLTPGKQKILLMNFRHWYDGDWQKITDRAHHKLGVSLD